MYFLQMSRKSTLIKKGLLLLLIIVIIGIGSSYEYQCQIEDDLAEKELFEPFENDSTVEIELDTLIHYH